MLAKNIYGARRGNVATVTWLLAKLFSGTLESDAFTLPEIIHLSHTR